MRPILVNDLHTAARTLMAVPRAERLTAMNAIMVQAQAADLYRKRLGRSHRVWGNGTLASACQSHACVRMPSRCDAEFLDCLGVVVQTLRKPPA